MGPEHMDIICKQVGRSGTRLIVVGGAGSLYVDDTKLALLLAAPAEGLKKPVRENKLRTLDWHCRGAYACRLFPSPFTEPTGAKQKKQNGRC
jgi:putative NADH-flavin reductase